ncbi:MAG: hypothetical protein EBZ69_00520 [Alphaproteobacteria bacterium]|nr:hypothetical protein [Alphaproteobacteria bacterium]
MDKFGTEALTWEPNTILLEIEEEFNVDLPQLALDKLLVGIQILTTDRFYKSLPDFISFCNVLSGDTYRPDMWDPADAEEVAWGVTEALLIYPPEDNEEEPFTDEIRAYIGAVLDREGLINPPDILRIALRQARVSPSIDDFSDDPTMFNAVYDLEEGKRADIENTIRMRTKMLAAQFKALKLENGQVDKIVKMLESAAE